MYTYYIEEVMLKIILKEFLYNFGLEKTLLKFFFRHNIKLFQIDDMYNDLYKNYNLSNSSLTCMVTQHIDNSCL